MQTAQPHMGNLQFIFVNLHGPYHYLLFFASHTCFNQSEHLCRLIINAQVEKSYYTYELCRVQHVSFEPMKKKRDHYICTVWSKYVLVRNTRVRAPLEAKSSQP